MPAVPRRGHQRAHVEVQLPHPVEARVAVATASGVSCPGLRLASAMVAFGHGVAAAHNGGIGQVGHRRRGAGAGQRAGQQGGRVVG